MWNTVDYYFLQKLGITRAYHTRGWADGLQYLELAQVKVTERVGRISIG